MAVGRFDHLTDTELEELHDRTALHLLEAQTLLQPLLDFLLRLRYAERISHAELLKVQRDIRDDDPTKCGTYVAVRAFVDRLLADGRITQAELDQVLAGAVERAN